MSLEEFLVSECGSETYRIAAAYQLLEWAKMVAFNNDKKRKGEEIRGGTRSGDAGGEVQGYAGRAVWSGLRFGWTTNAGGRGVDGAGR